MSSSPSSAENRPARTIAARLTLLFILSMAFLLFGAAGVLYGIVVHQMNEQSKHFLWEKLVDARVDLEEAGGAQELAEELRATRPAREGGYWFRLIDSDGTVLSETRQMEKILPRTLFSKPVRLRSDLPESLKTQHVGSKWFALHSAELRVDDHTYTLQVAHDRSHERAFERMFRAVLAGVVGCGLLASAGIACIVTKRGLLPLNDMVAAVRSVGANRLHERLPTSGWPGELAPLSSAFNQMLDRLQDSFQRLSQFSADIAHELRTPITNLRGEAEVALSKERTAEEYRQVIESSVEEYGNLSSMIDSFLFLARSDTSDATIERRRFEASGPIGVIIELYEGIALEQGVNVRCSGDGSVSADPLLFRRAFDNLLSNALRFTPRGGRIEVTVDGGPSSTNIRVADTGCGIPEEHLPKVFERLYRVDPSRSSEGTGLGLAIVKTIMNLHGGTVSMHSEPGSGTTVTLVFPNMKSEE